MDSSHSRTAETARLPCMHMSAARVSHHHLFSAVSGPGLGRNCDPHALAVGAPGPQQEQQVRTQQRLPEQTRRRRLHEHLPRCAAGLGLQHQ